MIWFLLALLLGLIAGILLTLTIQWYIFYSYFLLQPIEKPEFTASDFIQPSVQLPEELLKLLDVSQTDSKKKESCISLNLILQFLFKELRDTVQMKRWFMKKLSLEFEELLQRTTTGKLLEQVMIQDLVLGNHFPIIKSISLKNVQLHESGHIEELDILLDLDYMGGFHLSVTVDMVLGRSAFLSVKVTRLQGQVRLQFTRQPYTHWSFSFCEEPLMDFQVESHFQGRPLPQVTSLIINQIRRSVRKKHTLPNYKMRYKPFFSKPEEPLNPQNVHLLGNKLTEGLIDVTIIECTRLFKSATSSGSLVYCTLAVDSSAWVELVLSCNTSWVTRDLDIVRQPGQPVGITFIQDDDSTGGSHSIADDDGEDSTDSGGKVSPGMKSPLPQTSPVKRAVQKQTGPQSNILRKGRSPADSPSHFAKKSGEERRSSSLISMPKMVEVDGPNGNVILKRTSPVKFVEAPSWNETLSFEVEEHQQFLNVCVWCQNLDSKIEKQEKNPRPEKDILLGHVSILLLDIAMECASNSKGIHQRSFRLSPPEPKAVASRSHKLASHPGFDEKLCYGDINLAFLYQPQPIPKNSRQPKNSSTKDSGAESDEEGYAILAETSVNEEENKATSEHDFIITQFHSTVFCKFCTKKVWLKMAFQCRLCAAVCHKKCVAKCQAATICSRDESLLRTPVNTIQQPEIITTDAGSDDPCEKSQMNDNARKTSSDASSSLLESPQTQRRLRSLLSNLAAAATHSNSKSQIESSSGLTRTGSAHNLALPSQQQLPFQSKSLPPSPQASPAASRKTSLQGNLFQMGRDSETEEDVETTVQRLLQYSNDEMLVSVAKEKGRELFSNYSLEERKEKLNSMIGKLQVEIDLETENRNELAQMERRTSDSIVKTTISLKIAKSDEKTQALAILMLYYCSGLQYCQEIEEALKAALAVGITEPSE